MERNNMKRSFALVKTNIRKGQAVSNSGGDSDTIACKNKE